MAAKKKKPDKSESRPFAYVCLWQWDPPEKYPRDSRCWRLVECYGIDEDGYACTPSELAADDQDSYDDFIFEYVWRDGGGNRLPGPPEGQDEDDADRERVPGRAVTIWTFDNGVRLAEFAAPGLYPPWLSPKFAERLCKSDTWFEDIEGGHYLQAGTARAVEEIVFAEER